MARRVGSLSGQAPPPPAGTAAGNSRETVITFAGVCFASGETDDAIASQIHLFLVLFHRAKALWVSWRRPDVSALVSAVSSRGAVSSMGATKFAQRRLSIVRVRKYSPNAGKMAQNECFIACWVSFFAPTGTVTTPRSPRSTLKPGRPLRHCPAVRRNRPCTRIGYCDMDRL